MRKGLMFALAVILPLFIIQSNVIAKNAIFISKYNSRSMDDQTLDYYEKISNSFDVDIIQDSSVADGDNEWRDLMKTSELAFITSLSDEMLNESMDEFCENLADLLNESVGIVFAGNSLVFDGNESGNISGCLYSEYFDFSEGSQNTNIITNRIDITNSHEITEGYNEGQYNLGESKNIYPIVYPNGGKILANVNGDPDGPGPIVTGQYPLMVLWQGITYNVLSFGITASELTGCDNCLGWNLFTQAIEWVSDGQNMGFNISTDKEEYFLDERIEIEVNSDVEMSDVNGRIVYPDGESYDLTFTGSGKKWESIYLLQDRDPLGTYMIFVSSGGVESAKTIKVNAMEIILEIDNSTEITEINIDIFNKYGNELESPETEVFVSKPSNTQDKYSFTNISSIKILYNVTETGGYTVFVNVKDINGNTQSDIEDFYYKIKPKLEFQPKDLNQTINEATNLTKIVLLINKGNESVNNIIPIKGGEIADWIEFNQSELSVLSGNLTEFKFNISVPEVTEREYTGFINFSSENGFNIFPISIKLDYLGDLEVDPSSYEESLTLGETKEIEFWLSNKGKGDLGIKSITPGTDIRNWLQALNEPKFLISGGKVPLRFVVKIGRTTNDIYQKVSGDIEIITDMGIYQPSPQITLNIYSDISSKVERFYPDLISVEKKIEELGEKSNVEDLREEIERLRGKISNVQELYENDQLQSSYTMYNEIESEITELNSKVDERENELKEKKSKAITTIITLVIIVIVGFVVYKIYKKIKEKREYGWLYKKWKNKLSL